MSVKILTLLIISALIIDGITCDTDQNKTERHIVYHEAIARLVLDPSWIYMEEAYGNGYKVYTLEDSVDQRVANAFLSHAKLRVYDSNVHTFYPKSQYVTKEYERYTRGPEVDKRLCRIHLTRMVELLDDFKRINDAKRYHLMNIHLNTTESPPPQAELDIPHVRLARALNSFGKHPSGLMDGEHTAYGSPVACLDTKLQLNASDPEELVGTRSCILRLSPYEYLDPHLLAYIKDEDHIPSGIRVHVCLPNTCHSGSLKANHDLIQKLVFTQFVLPPSLFMDPTRNIEGLFCLNDGNESIGYPTQGKILITLIALWISAVVLVTIVGNRFRVARILSRYFDLRVLLDLLAPSQDLHLPQEPSTRVNLNPLNYVKVSIITMVILTHCVAINFVITSDPARTSKELGGSSFLALIFTPYLVDISFAISGILMAYLGLKTLARTPYANAKNPGIFDFIKYSGILFLKRYLRLVPLFWLIHQFKKNIYIYSGSGITWDHGFNANTTHGGCKEESWYVPLTPLASYRGDLKSCLPLAWSTGCDILYSLIVPVIVVLMVRKARLALVISVVLSLIGALLMYGSALLIDFDPDNLRVYSLIRSISNEAFIYTYNAAHHRLSSVLFGAIGGYLLYRYDIGEIKQWPEWIETLPLIGLVGALSVVVINATGIYLSTPRANLQSIFIVKQCLPHFLVTLRMIWVPINIGYMLQLVTGRWDGTYLVEFSKRKIWKPLSKLIYPVHLILFDVLFLHILASGQTPSFSIYQISTRVAFTLTYSLIVGFIVHILFESPINLICSDMTRILIKDRGSPVKEAIRRRALKKNK